MKILVTGGAGFIGSHTVVALIENGYQPIIIDDYRNSEPFIIDSLCKITGKNIPHYAFDIGNSTELTKVFEKENPSGIIHFAANKAVNESVSNPLKYYHNNLSNLVTFLNVVEKFPVEAFVFSSSCTVYGIPDQIPVNENAPVKKAFSPYGYTKQVGEKILADFFKNQEKTSMSTLRYFNPIGAHPSALIGELPIGVPNNLVPFITQTAIGKRKELTIFGDDYQTIDGTCIRDYIHVADLANAHVLSLNHNLQKKESVLLNVGTGEGYSVMQVLNAFQQVNDISVAYKIGGRRDGDVPAIYADNSLIKQKINWQPKYSLEDALQHAWRWEQKLAER